MAKQASMIQLEGSLGKICFYKTSKGFYARRKGGASKSKIKNDPAFARVRENNEEFKRAVGAGQLFRNVFALLLRRVGGKGLTGRLMRTMMKVIKGDAVNTPGQRSVEDGEPLLLEGFEINEACALRSTFLAPFGASIDRAHGVMIVDIQAFSPAGVIPAPGGATHFRLFSGGAAIDFERSTFDVATSETACLPISQEAVGPLQLIQKVKPDSPGVWFLLFGIEFLKVVNGKETPMRNGRLNALAVVRVGDR